MTTYLGVFGSDDNVSKTMYPPKTKAKMRMNPTATAVLVVAKQLVNKNEKAIKQLPHRNKYRKSMIGE